MLLKHKFDDAEVNLAIELFLRMQKDFFGEMLVSVILHGSVVFDDLAPGYGDLDFLTVVEGELSKEMINELIELRRPLRSGDYGVVATMIEGPFLPRKMLDPAVPGRALCWGTGGERFWEANKLGWFVHQVIRERGLVVWGEDIRCEIPAPTLEDLTGEARSCFMTIRDHGQGGNLHSVDWLLSAARMLLWLRENRFSSKSEAADWGYLHAKGDWREMLPKAKELRLNPSMAEADEVKRWLEGLTPPIQQACDELTLEFAKGGKGQTVGEGAT